LPTAASAVGGARYCSRCADPKRAPRPTRKEPFDDPEWLFDFKYDGFSGPLLS
jgi:hypothetical protein